MTQTGIRISKSTLGILKNFSGINSNLLVRPGNKISTISPGKNMMAEAVVVEEFDTEFGIWDLNKFLGVLSLFNDPTLYFGEKSVEIEGPESKVRYYYSEPKLLTAPTKTVKMPESLTEFTIHQDTFAEMLKASSVLQLPQITFECDGASLNARLHDEEDSTSNTYVVNLGSCDENFESTIDIEHLRLLPGDYQVTISKGPVSEFKNLSVDLTYWIALKSD